MTLEISAEEQDRRTTYILGLTEDDKAERMKGLGASDANIICGGDPEKLYQLWQVKCGLIEPEDLSNILAVQMGTWTEALNIYWFEKQTGKRVVKRKEKFPHPKHSFIVARPEGLTDSDQSILECKHVGAFHYDLNTIRERYLPQVTVQIACCGAERGYLSVFSGNNKWEFDTIERDVIYEQEVLAQMKAFWRHVEERTPPHAMEALTAPLPPNLLRKVSMSSNQVWCAAEQQYFDSQEAASLFEKAKKSMKGLVENDVGEAFGPRLKLKRSKDNKLLFSETKGGK